MNPSSSPKVLRLLALGVVSLIVVVGIVTSLSNFKGTDPGVVCVVQEGGPFDGRAVKEVRQGGEGPKFIGWSNVQRCFPSTQRNYTLSSNAAESDSKSVDDVTVPTLDAVNVHIQGQALFTLNTDPKVIEAFYKAYGVRAYNGLVPYEGDDGWESYLAVQFRPILENALRESVGSFRCTELNNTCQYVQNADQAVRGKTEEVDANQNLDKAQRSIEQRLQSGLNSTLGGNYFTNIRFRLKGVTFDRGVAQQVAAAQAKRTEVATASLEAQRKVQEAKGNTNVAREQAEQIRVKARAYRSSPQQADIEKLKALCGSTGCKNLQVIGGSATKLLSK